MNALRSLSEFWTFSSIVRSSAGLVSTAAGIAFATASG